MIMTVNPPMVSVVMPVYRCERYIKGSIESILNQSYVDFELIIVSDDSTPEMREILDKFQLCDSRVKVIHQVRKGYFFSRNQCCQLAKGTYIAVMDCDDLSYAGRLLTQVQFLESHPDVGVVGSWFKIIDESGNVLGKQYCPTLPLVVRWTLLFGNALGHGTVMMRRKVLEEVGFYNSGDIGFCEDYDLWIRLLKITNIANIPEFLLKYRIRNESITQQQHLLLCLNAIEISRSQISELLQQAIESEYSEKLYTLKNINSVSEVQKLIKLLDHILMTFLLTFPCSLKEQKKIKKDASIRMACICFASARSTHLRSAFYLFHGIKLNPLLPFDLPTFFINRILNRLF
jgi:glycosyltransferase involved in cell wall biosynthesis